MNVFGATLGFGEQASVVEEWLRGVGDAFCGREVVLVDGYHAGDWLVLWTWGFKDLDMRVRSCGLDYRLV